MIKKGHVWLISISIIYSATVLGMLYDQTIRSTREDETINERLQELLSKSFSNLDFVSPTQTPSRDYYDKDLVCSKPSSLMRIVTKLLRKMIPDLNP